MSVAIPEGAGWNIYARRDQIPPTRVAVDGESEWMEWPGLDELRETWARVATHLDKGEGYYPGCSDPLPGFEVPPGEYRWIRVINDRTGKVIVTLYVHFAKSTPRREFWHFPETLFAVHSHAGHAPNPMDYEPDMRAYVNFGAIRYGQYPQQDPVEYEHGVWERPGIDVPKQDPLVEYVKLTANRAKRDTNMDEPGALKDPTGSKAKGMRPIGGVQLQSIIDVWQFPHWKVSTGKLLPALIAIRRAGQQRVTLSTLQKVVEGQARRNRR
ncbi:hypothetical protein F7230_06910 [Corynebacterium sp. 320]|uniref:hypothetical protein n=1 Tax=Corynebacterium TaxID=1716 RepID=UPI00125CBDDD|nr:MULTISPECIES: hypothetical protein [Corynebacterium]KAB1502740.1 hypothetical protein F7230_06910 [Corynebacterium sp. 320]KAB1550522.1 hypothetical protein F7232_09600 [Corynebacterium sp. 319]KAB1554750.1 hypothetical protein F7233_00225 [Corynebacterium sp. 321]KAB3526403.1 hypothetical protein F8354_06910 [Corynebacterium sp. 250]KAB3537746.1 hypothetical protein F8390_09815 [Corynebacterium sp. 366]